MKLLMLLSSKFKINNNNFFYKKFYFSLVWRNFDFT
jgi:hypothetical protein